MPCQITYNGDANVANFFDPTIRKNEGTEQDISASFRGRKLRGAVMQPPAGYSGFILREDRQPTTEEQDHHLKVTKKFNKFHYWNLETPPSGNDAVAKAMQWITLASVLHGQTDDEAATPDTIR
ncbi:predicted protein [Nematostella vectensis]|uniref:Uncharacterized protein n=1 Tax=Nematostella vectensis TaxID=45351 RepID=A7T538_NEMVE|nr:predicted protein [Nematostella vectensis]|eukprot:XP_001621023.1 hypothetical protein NEMVEDRAFT_v1g195792 [Nematostella vectensis]